MPLAQLVAVSVLVVVICRRHIFQRQPMANHPGQHGSSDLLFGFTAVLQAKFRFGFGNVNRVPFPFSSHSTTYFGLSVLELALRGFNRTLSLPGGARDRLLTMFGIRAGVEETL